MEAGDVYRRSLPSNLFVMAVNRSPRTIMRHALAFWLPLVALLTGMLLGAGIKDR